MSYRALGTIGLFVVQASLLAACATSATPQIDHPVEAGVAKQSGNWQDCLGILGTLLPPSPRLPDCVARSGPIATSTIRISVGQSLQEVEAASSFPKKFPADSFFTDDAVNLEWIFNQRRFLFDNVGGTGQSVLHVVTDRLRSDPATVSIITFDWQNRPLTLAEAIARARRFETWLRAGGFQQPASDRLIDRPFVILEDGFQPPARFATDWPSAEIILADDSEDIETMLLFSLVADGVSVSVRAKNDRRSAANFGRREGEKQSARDRRTIYDGTGGYEWSLDIEIYRDRRS
jgi:hypothetical protein